MSNLTIAGGALPATTPKALEVVNAVAEKARTLPQLHIQTEHILHGGMYARTIRLNARVSITSVMIKVPTMLTVNGCCRVFAGENWYDIRGFHVMPACAGRKMIYITAEPTEITMIFPTNAKTIEEAERQFTDDFEQLLSRQCNDDVITITGVEPCQV